MSDQSRGKQPPANKQAAPSIQDSANEKGNHHITPSASPITNPQPAANAAAQTDQSEKYTVQWWRDVLEIIFFILAIPALMFAGCQVHQTNQALALQRHQMALDERAWVTVYKVEPRPDKTNVFLVTFKNTGKTPAINTTKWLAFATSSDEVLNFKPSGSEEKFIILGPDNTFDGDTGIFPVSDDTFRWINLTNHLYLIGIVKYDDIFRSHHWTRFCYDVTSGMKAFQGTPFGNSCDDM